VRRSEQRRPGKPRAVSSPAPLVKESPMKQMRMSGRFGAEAYDLWGDRVWDAENTDCESLGSVLLQSAMSISIVLFSWSSPRG
jgi:hypothetical protein